VQWSMLCCCHEIRWSCGKGLPSNLPGNQQGKRAVGHVRVWGLAIQQM
jgi:hypothetical protein